MKRSSAIVFTFLALFALEAHSYTFDDYKKAQMGEYQAYLSEMDRQFSDFLKQQWLEYKGQKAEKPYVEPKPAATPVAPKPVVEPIKIVPKPTPKPEPAPESKPIQESKPAPAATPAPESKAAPQPAPTPVTKAPEPVTVPVPAPPVVVAPAEPQPYVPVPQPPYVPTQKTIVMSFFGLRLDIPYDSKITSDVATPLSSENIAAWWERTASADYSVSARYLQDVARRNMLGDWGYVMLLDRFTAKLKGAGPEQKMLVWFFLNKGGYDARLGYTANGTVKVMVPTDVALFGVPYFTFGGVKYYVVNSLSQKETTDSLYTYNGSYPAAKSQMKFLKLKNPSLGFVRYDRELKFEYGGQQYKINAMANKNDIQYFDNFPQADLEVYTSAQVPVWIDKTVVPQLADDVKGKSLTDSVNLILRFVQTAFSYKTDDQQFGREKFFFAEETIYYPYSDCEDRSVLFAYLVETILGKDVVMLNFPNHVATAVDMGTEVNGAYLTYKGKRYTVADPTYINAVAGMVMPEFKNVSPEIEETGI